MLSGTCKYALRAVIYLAVNDRQGDKIGIKKISRDLEIPTPFLSKILQTLARHKILTSIKGPNGGFGIGRPVDEIYLMDIVEIIDGLDFFNRCVIGVKNCSELDTPCALHSKYSKFREELKKSFESETIADLIVDIEKGKQKINI